MKSFSMKHYAFSSEGSGPPKFGSCQNRMSSANLVTKTHFKLSNERALSIGNTVLRLQCFGYSNAKCYERSL